jgi:SAM-dependent methyltransferase
MDYNIYHARLASSYLDIKDKKVLVVGCNRGKEVGYFIEFGAQEVWGIDLIDEIGEEFAHDKAKYFQMSAEKMDIPDNTFDLVYSFATMEHVINIEHAFSEMVRVTKPEGIIYSLAAPLWYSRQGHHKSDIFDIDKYPWIHIRFTKEEIKAKCKAGEIAYPDWVADINVHIDYMMDPRFFNFRPAKDYINICNQLEEIEIIQNDLGFEKEYYLALLTLDDFKDLSDNGISSVDLLGLTHTFVGQKQKTVKSKITAREENSDKYVVLRKKFRKAKEELRQAKDAIQAMESSKFWKLRSIWFGFKKRVGL